MVLKYARGLAIQASKAQTNYIPRVCQEQARVLARQAEEEHRKAEESLSAGYAHAQLRRQKTPASALAQEVEGKRRRTETVQNPSSNIDGIEPGGQCSVWGSWRVACTQTWIPHVLSELLTSWRSQIVKKTAPEGAL